MSNKQRLVDIVNLNADASCLSTKRWLKALKGGIRSELYGILSLYIKADIKINLGIIGSTIAEIEELNPECIKLINDHPENFEILIRPFIHSLSILWSDDIFNFNYNLGKEYINKLFTNTINWYLPPEFALRNSQIYSLANDGCSGTFIHPKRVKENTKGKIPDGLFNLKSIQNSMLPCINFTENYDSYYLDQLQVFKSDYTFSEETIFGWRDGESPFILPNSVEREAVFVKNSSQGFDRVFLSEILSKRNTDESSFVYSYPQNSLLPWLGNFRLHWFIQEVKRLENAFGSLSMLKKKLFINLLNSDILSSIEKTNVKIKLGKTNSKGNSITPYLIVRKERNLDAEELLYLVLQCDDNMIIDFLKTTDTPFLYRIKARLTAIDKHSLLTQKVGEINYTQKNNKS